MYKPTKQGCLKALHHVCRIESSPWARVDTRVQFEQWHVVDFGLLPFCRECGHGVPGPASFRLVVSNQILHGGLLDLACKIVTNFLFPVSCHA